MGCGCGESTPPPPPQAQTFSANDGAVYGSELEANAVNARLVGRTVRI